MFYKPLCGRGFDVLKGEAIKELTQLYRFTGGGVCLLAESQVHFLASI